MGYAPVTSFRRAIDAAQITIAAPSSGRLEPVNKWHLLRELTAAREAFGVTDRDLRILQALLSFHPGDMLEGSGPLIIYPSNTSICERLHGMPCSTMRRHLGNLVSSGLLGRRDSPNGKRYVRRGLSGSHAFGFDLAPLIERFTEIAAEAHNTRIRDEHLRDLRETVSLMRRDLAGLVEYHAKTAPSEEFDTYTALAIRIASELRRKLSEQELRVRQHELKEAIASLHSTSCPEKCQKTAKMSTNTAEIEQHYQNHIKERKDSENCPETAKRLPQESRIPLGMVIANCQEILSYALHPVKHWRDLISLAEQVRPMTGITRQVWENAKALMGVENATATLAVILERFSEIRTPSAYLARLSSKAFTGTFSATSMVRSIQRPARPIL
ncbi:plasmid replication protein RepC [Paracoccus ravus]|uniref:plasmid replication protein RepC n=1 Tax=Paracoccus ravus TaxID=2447760 RepID=UPI00106E2710|nr:plasmid replication protein RepC [Paracoccus ravus]